MATPPKPVRTELVAGRPSKYHDRLLPQVRRLAKIGATEMEIAELLGINQSTFIDWKATYQRFSNALILGRKQSDERVKRALYHRAIGYSHTTEKAFNDKGSIIKAEVRESLPPDTNAAIFWLKNRRPDEWQDRSVVDGSMTLNVGEMVTTARQRVLQARAAAPTIEGETDGRELGREDT